MDVAALGFDVDSQPIKALNDQLARTPAAASSAVEGADKAEAAYRRVTTAASMSAKQLSGSLAASIAATEAGYKRISSAAGNIAKSSGDKGQYGMVIDATEIASRIKAMEELKASMTALQAVQVKNKTETIAASAAVSSAVMSEASTVAKSTASNVISIEAELAVRKKAAAEAIAALTALRAAQVQEGAARTAALRAQLAATFTGTDATKNMRAEWENSVAVARQLTNETGRYTSSLVTQALEMKKTTETSGLLTRALVYMKSAYGSLIATALALTAATLGAVSLYKFITASVEAENAAAKLNATLEATKGAAGQSAEEITKHAQALQRVTTFGDDAIVASSALLLTFTRIKGDVFPKATEAILDLSSALGMDLESATKAVGRALQNPIKGMLTLRKMGVDLSASEKALVTNFVAVNNVAGAQEVILKKLESRYGGNAKAMRDTLGGALKALGEAFGDLFELPAETMDPFKNAIETLIKTIQNPAFDTFVKTIGAALFGALTLATQGLTLLGEGINFLVENIDVLKVAGATALIAFSPAIIGGIIAGLTSLGAAGVAAMNAITAAAMKNPFIAIGVALVALTTAVYVFRDDIKRVFGVDIMAIARDAGNFLIKTFLLALADIKFVYNHLGEVVRDVMVGAINIVLKYWDMALQKMASGIDWLSDQIEKVNPTGIPIPKIGQLHATEPFANPDATSAAAAIAALKAQREQIKNSDPLSQIGKSAEANTPKVKKFAAALGDVDDAIDTTGSKSEDPYAKIIKGAQAFIEKQEAEAKGIGMASQEALKYKYTTELLSKAKEADIALTTAQTAELNKYAQQMADAETKTLRLKQVNEAMKGGREFIEQQLAEQEAIGLSAEAAARLRYEKELLAKATKDGIPILEEERAALIRTAAEMAAVEARTVSMRDSFDFARSTTKSFFSEMFSAAAKGKSIWEVFGNTVERVLDKMIDKLSDLVTDGIFDLLSGKGGEGGTGIFSALGRALGGSSSNATGTAGGGGLGSLFSNIKSGIGSLFDQTSNWFSGLFGSGGMSGVSNLPAGVMGPAPNTAVGGLSSLSAMNYLGAGIGALTGAMKLFNSSGIADTIGGIGSIIGAGVSLIPGIGQIAGPIISILSSVLPGLFGDSKPNVETSGGYSTIGYKSGKGFVEMAGGSSGPHAPDANVSAGVNSIGAAMGSILDNFRNGIVDASKVWGISVSNLFQKWRDGQTNSITDSYLWNPETKSSQYLGTGPDTPAAAGVQATINSILGGAVGEISEALRTALDGWSQRNPQNSTNFAALQETITFVSDVYDQLGKPAIEAEAAFKQLSAQFKQIEMKATELGLSLGPVAAGLKKAKEDLAATFMEPINMVLDPVGTAMAAFAKEMQQSRAEAQYLIDQGMGSIVSMAKLNEFYLRKEMALKEQLYGVSVKELQAAIDSMTVGAMSNATVTTQFNAAKIAFEKTVSDALKGDTSASARVLDEGATLAELAKRQFGSSKGFEDVSNQIVTAYQLLKQMMNATPAPAPTPANDDNDSEASEEMRAAYQLIAKQNTIILNQNAQQNKLMSKLDKLADLMQRQVSNR